MDRRLSAIVVDDDKDALVLLTTFLQRIKGIGITGKTTNAENALSLIETMQPDLVFLDIEMPGINGIELGKIIQQKEIKTHIIFTTAHDAYTIEAIRLAAFDYLLKPVDYEELKITVERFRNKESGSDSLESLSRLFLKINNKINRIRLNVRTGYIFIDPDDLIYCEADGNYTNMILKEDKSHLVSTNLGKIEDLLKEYKFFRISRSTLINMKYLRRVDRKAGKCEISADHKSYFLHIPAKKIKILESIY
ncbi:MAG TPA: LytTR family DNA-binding domain-containing protein [Bacteroidales bacterium]|nr:LytTR family DNA-binding domain-containing protein [Bacteroidales bacterium]